MSDALANQIRSMKNTRCLDTLIKATLKLIAGVDYSRALITMIVRR